MDGISLEHRSAGNRMALLEKVIFSHHCGVNR